MKKLILIPILFAICGCLPHYRTNLRIGERYREETPKRKRFYIEKPPIRCESTYRKKTREYASN